MTFAPEPLPLVELGLALTVVQRTDAPAVFGRWRTRVLRELPGRARPLFDLLRPDGDNPPSVEPYARTLDEGLADVAAAAGRRPTGAELHRAAARVPGSPSWPHALWAGDRDEWTRSTARCGPRTRPWSPRTGRASGSPSKPTWPGAPGSSPPTASGPASPASTRGPAGTARSSRWPHPRTTRPGWAGAGWC
ncbi:hypothetical protein [Streptomyces sp. NPDC047718]|uniref:hypothetical protein n=1 Tax=Streptomyces sp. NPDC047718 TaxID=3155479 RepID=UPI00340B9E25